jgi:hypothetical protein
VLSSPSTSVELFATLWQAYKVGRGKEENLSRRKSTVKEIVPLEISATHSSVEWKQEVLDISKSRAIFRTVRITRQVGLSCIQNNPTALTPSKTKLIGTGSMRTENKTDSFRTGTKTSQKQIEFG